MPRPAPALVLLVVLPALLAGCTGGDGGPGNKVSRSLSVPEGGSAEANLAMDAGAGVTYEWETEPAVNLTFDIHTHENGTVDVLRSETATAGEGAFEAPRNGTFSLYWRDPAKPVRLIVTIEGDFTLESFPVS